MPAIPAPGKSDVYVATGESTHHEGRDVHVAPTNGGGTPIGANP